MTISSELSRPYDLLISGAQEIIGQGFNRLWRTKGYNMRILLEANGQSSAHIDVSNQFSGSADAITAKVKEVIRSFAAAHPIDDAALNTASLRLDLCMKLLEPLAKLFELFFRAF